MSRADVSPILETVEEAPRESAVIDPVTRVVLNLEDEVVWQIDVAEPLWIHAAEESTGTCSLQAQCRRPICP